MTKHILIFLFLITHQHVLAVDNTETPENRVSFVNLPQQVCSIISNDKNMSLDIENKADKDHRQYREFFTGKTEEGGFTDKISEFFFREQEQAISQGKKFRTWSTYGEGPDYKQFCSATVVSANQVLTAAHCMMFSKSRKYLLKCPGGITKEFSDKNVELHPKYSSFEPTRNDFAVVTLVKPLGIKPANIVTTLSKVEEIHEVNKCFAFGYGDTDLTRWQGTLSGTKKDVTLMKSIKWTDYQRFIDLALPLPPRGWSRRGRSYYEIHHEEALELAKRTVYPQSGLSGEQIIIYGILLPEKGFFMNIGPGDSGGSLLCQDKNKEWNILGVLSGFGPSEKSKIVENWGNVYFHKEWVKSMVNTDLSGPKQLKQTKIKKYNYYLKRMDNVLKIYKEMEPLLDTEMEQVISKIVELKRKSGPNIEIIILEMKKIIQNAYDRLLTISSPEKG